MRSNGLVGLFGRRAAIGAKYAAVFLMIVAATSWSAESEDAICRTDLLLSRGPRNGGMVYANRHERKPVFGLTPNDLVVARISREQGECIGEWAQITGVAPRLVAPRDELYFGGTIHLEELVPTRLESMPGTRAVNGVRRVELVSAWHNDFYQVAEYSTALGPVLSIVVHTRPGLGFVSSMYYLDSGNRPHWIFCGEYEEVLLLVPGLQVVSEVRGAGDVPDVVAFKPPFGLICWRWQGDRFTPVFPTAAEFWLLGKLLLRGYSWCLSLLGACSLIYIAGLRSIVTRKAAVLCLVGWSVILTLAVSTPAPALSFTGFVLIVTTLLPGAWLAIREARESDHRWGRDAWVSLGLIWLFSITLPFCFALAAGWWETHGIAFP